MASCAEVWDTLGGACGGRCGEPGTEVGSMGYLLGGLKLRFKEFCRTPVHARHDGQFLNRSLTDAVNITAKVGKQCLAPRWTNAVDFIQLRARLFLLAQIAMIGNRKA